MKLHPTQAKLFNLAMTRGLEGLTLQEMAVLVGLEHRQLVKHHLLQLERMGLINPSNGRPTKSGPTSIFIDIPILGLADCGPASKLAEESIRGYIKLSAGFAGDKQSKLFAVQASGNSMNDAEFKKRTTDTKTNAINDGDYLIIDPEISSPNSGDYILSVIDGAANIKRFYRDSEKIMLLSESTDDYPPIVIHPSDFKDYMVNGRVIDVIKKPNLNNQI